MEISLYSTTVPLMKKGLNALSGVLDKAAAHLAENGGDEAALLQKRFAPDMFPLMKQVQVACDNAKGFIFRMAGETPPSIEDTETTIAQLKERIAKTVAMLDAADKEKIDAATMTEIRLPYFAGMHFKGFDYAYGYVIPNFFFHLTTAYDLIRAEGVPVGKADYIGGLSLNKDA